MINYNRHKTEYYFRGLYLIIC